MSTNKIQIIVEGATGRLGNNQHLRALLNIRKEGGLLLKNGDHLIGLFQGMFEKNILTFNPGWSQDAQTLDSFGVAVRAGHHCAQPLMDRFDLDGTTRVSMAPYNDSSDIDALLTGVRHAAKTLR